MKVKEMFSLLSKERTCGVMV